MRRSGHPSRPRARICCFVSSPKMLAIPAGNHRSPRRVNVLGRCYLTGRFSGVYDWPVLGVHRGLQVAYESKDTGSQALQDRVVKEWTAHALKRIAWGEVKIGTILPVRVSGLARVPATHSMSSSRLILSRAVTKARFVRQRRDKTRSRQRQTRRAN